VADILTKQQRHKNMSNIRGKNTKPEIFIRKMIYHMGFRYRLHRKDLPGTPDLAFLSKKKVIFIHGCFWHKHNCKKGFSTPKTNSDFWREKRAKNVERDKNNLRKLRDLGWAYLIIWECSIKKRNMGELSITIMNFLK
jgi:DNA mismatch endonuclease, patch repair protein